MIIFHRDYGRNDSRGGGRDYGRDRDDRRDYGRDRDRDDRRDYGRDRDDRRDSGRDRRDTRYIYICSCIVYLCNYPTIKVLCITEYE